MPQTRRRTISRRGFLAGSAAVATTALLAERGWVDAQPFFGPDGIDVEGLERNGYLVRHTICHQCGAGCGLTALVKEGMPPSQEAMLILPNQHPDHPQRGMCGRGATAPYTWDSPLRLRRPRKRVGERGEGRFEEISWEQAFEEIGAQLREIIERDGARSVAISTHDFKTESNLLAWGLGTPNAVSQASTCNTAGVVGRRWMMGSGFHSHSTVDPDYDNVRYILFPGRSLNAPIGAVHRLAAAREHGAKVVFLNPAHPDVAYADAEWLSCVPGTDAAFMLGVAHVLVDEDRFDEGFVTRYTNLPFLIKEDGRPLTQADLQEDGDEGLFALMGADGRIAFHQDDGLAPDLAYAGPVSLADGTQAQVTTAWNLFLDHLDDYAPERAAAITGITAATIQRIARELATMGGVVEDTWYNTRNGNDTDAVMALMTVNGLLGNLDRPGGICFRPSAKLPGAVGASGGTVSMITGDSFDLRIDDPRVDKAIYPETNATFDAVIGAILEEEPYPVKALVLFGATVFQRDPNVARSEEALRKLDLIVNVDIVDQEMNDWSDYVLPAEMFLERPMLASVGWTMTATAALQQKVTDPPPGAEPRPDAWIALEILRATYPRRAALFGHDERMADVETWRREWFDRIERLRLEGLAENWDRDPDELLAEFRDKGFVTFQQKTYEQTPYQRSFASPSGRLEVYAFHPVLRGYREHGFASYFDPPAYTMPRGEDEFFLVNGKSPIGSSGVASVAFPTQYLVDNRVWIHPDDAARLGLASDDEIEVEGLDTGWVARSRVNVTPRVHPGALFIYSYVGGQRGRGVQGEDGFGQMAEGLNPHWFARSWVDPVTGSNSNNASVRIRRA